MNTTLTAPLVTGTATYGGNDRERTAGGPPLTALLAALPLVGARVLVAGPHDDATVDTLADGGAAVTWLLRSTRDARDAARRHPDATIIAGDPMTATIESIIDDNGRGFDLVLAADGLERLASTETPATTWRRRLDRLLSLVATDGAIVVFAANPVGVSALSRLDRPAIPVVAGVEDAPETLDAFRATFTEAGLTTRAWSAFGSAPATVLIERCPAAIDGDALAEVLARAVHADHGGPALVGDPAPLLRVAVRTDRIADSATGWLVHARRGGAAPDAAPLIAADRSASSHRLSYQVDDACVTILDCGSGERDEIVRDPDGPLFGGGPSAESLLLAACAAHDRPSVRRVLREVVGLLHDAASDGLLTGPFALATLADVRFVDGRAVLGDGTWRSTAPIDVDVTIARLLRRAAEVILAGAHPHPWTTNIDGDALTASLAGAAGVRLDAAHIAAAIDLETRWRTIAFDLSDDEAEALRDRLTRLSDMDPPVSGGGYRELWLAWRALRRETYRLRERSEWESQILASRDLAIAKLDEELAMYQATFFGRLLRLLRLIAGAARADAKKVFRRLRPGADR